MKNEMVLGANGVVKVGDNEKQEMDVGILPFFYFLFFIFKLLSQKKLMSITIIIVLVFFIYGVNNVFEKKIFSQEIQKLVLPLLVIVCWSALNLALSSTLKFTLSNLSNRINSISLGFFLLLYISLNYSKRTSKYL